MQYNKGYDNAGMQSAAGPPAPTVVVGAPAQMSMQVQGKVDDHLGLALFATFCCFWPSGVFAIFKSMEARSAIDRGDLARGQSAAQSSRMVSLISIGVGVGILVVIAIIVGVYFGLYFNTISSALQFSNNALNQDLNNMNALNTDHGHFG